MMASEAALYAFVPQSRPWRGLTGAKGILARLTLTKDETAGGRGGNAGGLPGSAVDAFVKGVLGSITARQAPDAPAGDPSKCSPIAGIVVESSEGPTRVVGATLLGKSQVQPNPPAYGRVSCAGPFHIARSERNLVDMTMKTRLSPVILFLLASMPLAAETGFSLKPSAVKDGENVKITFAVAGPTDVEVAILNADGRVVRHLAAGVLGGQTPPPEPLKAGLAQTLAWDGRDDLGTPAGGGPFRVRVRLGLGVKLDGFLAERKQWVGDLRGLATDDRGNLYVYSSIVRDEGGRSPCLQVFDRAGTYLRTIMPMPANLPKSKLLPFNKTDVWANKLTLDPPGEHFQPRNYAGVWPHFYPQRWGMGYLLPRVGRDGVLMFRSDFYLNLAAVTTDGGCAGEFMERTGFKQKLWGSTYLTRGRRCVVRSPDGKYVYLCGFGRALGRKSAELDPKWPLGRIYRMKDEPGAFFGKWVDLPDGGAKAAAGAACFDGDGNLMVFNAGTGKATVFDGDGKQVGEFPALAKLDGEATAPARLFCHRKSGEVYADYLRKVGKRGFYKRKLVKFAPWKKGAAKVAEMDLPDCFLNWGMGRGQASQTDAMALDDSADPAVIWVGTAGVGKNGTDAKFRAPCYLLRIEERGKTFVKTADLIDRCRDGVICKTRLAVHPETDLVIYNDGYVGLGGVNGLTGEKVELPVKIGQDMAVGLDGNWYFHVGGGFYTSPICRYDKDLKPIPVPRQAAKDVPSNNMLGRVYSRRGAGHCTVGMAADQKGRVYSLQMWDWAVYGVAVFGPDGNPEDSGRTRALSKKKAKKKSSKRWLIGGLGGEVGGIQLDWQGNVYVGKKVMPPGHKPPAGYEHWKSGYFHGTGTIIKFAPSGGAIVAAKDAKGKQGLAVEPRLGRSTPMFAEGAMKLYPGLGCMSGKFGASCMCRQPMFQVDGWGRIFMPNAILNHVRVVDNAGNEILEFGHYGNIDSRGEMEGSMIRSPAIPLGWPEAVGVSRNHVYVADVLNLRIVRLKKVYGAEQVCAVE